MCFPYASAVAANILRQNESDFMFGKVQYSDCSAKTKSKPKTTELAQEKTPTAQNNMLGTFASVFILLLAVLRIVKYIFVEKYDPKPDIAGVSLREQNIIITGANTGLWTRDHHRGCFSN